MKEKNKYYPDVSSSPNFPEMEKRVLEFWKKDGTFKKSIDQRGSKNEYVFYDGPPFANGLPHYGHLLTSCVKDIDARYRTMKGQRVERRFGWDCHGLPAEMESEKELGVSGRKAIEDFGIEKFNKHCRESVMKYTNVWQDYIGRAGRWVDFENDYKTMDKDYMESVLWAFKQLYDKGLIYESHRVMPYSWAAQTPLSNFETRMDDAYREVEDKAIYVLFNMKERPEWNGLGSGKAYQHILIAWTTTPWTLPSNLALAISRNLEYMVHYENDVGYIGTVSAINKLFGTEYSQEDIIDVPPGILIGKEYEPLFPYFKDHKNAFRILDGSDFIEEGSGTGIVHMAPGFGEDDQRVCEKAGIELVCPVDEAGRFTSEVSGVRSQVSGKEKSETKNPKPETLNLEGMHVFDANVPIIKHLKNIGAWIKTEQYKHSYPHCWRTDTPLIYKAVPSWYVEVTKFKDRMVELNKGINWIPEHIRDGQFGKWLENARDWSISRNRFWGTPIPVWRTESGKIKVFGSIKELEDFFGVEVKDLHRPFIDELTKKEGGETWKRVTDVFDCWFESGAMPFAQVHYPFENKDWFDTHFPADFIVEYIGQTRGWFYTLVVLATALFDKIPFKNCICHGIILDENGKKLSKRLRNYPDPNDMFNTYGADAMRWRMVKEPVMHGGNLLISKDGSDIRDVVRLSIKPIWNAYSFFTLYANADGIKAYNLLEINDEEDSATGGICCGGAHAPGEHGKTENVMDRYILAKLKSAVKQIDESLDKYLMPEACAAFDSFFEVLNNWYIRRNKERFWKSEHDDDKQAAYDTLYTVLETMCRAAAPLLPFTLEEIFKGLEARDLGLESLHLQNFPDVSALKDEKELIAGMDLVRDACNAALAVRGKENIRVRQPLGKLTIVADGANDLNNKEYIALIQDEVNVKEVVFSDDVKSFANHQLKINFPILGKRLPEKMKQIIPASKKGEWKQVSGGGCQVAGELLLPEEFELTLVPKNPKGAQALSTNDALVVLDLTLTEELKKEGLARDLVRMIQEARKNAGLHVSDRIELALEADELIRQAAEVNEDYIKEQTLADAIEFGLGNKHNHSVENNIEGKKVVIGFSKVA